MGAWDGCESKGVAHSLLSTQTHNHTHLAQPACTPGTAARHTLPGQTASPGLHCHSRHCCSHCCCYCWHPPLAAPPAAAAPGAALAAAPGAALAAPAALWPAAHAAASYGPPAERIDRLQQGPEEGEEPGMAMGRRAVWRPSTQHPSVQHHRVLAAICPPIRPP